MPGKLGRSLSWNQDHRKAWSIRSSVKLIACSTWLAVAQTVVHAAPSDTATSVSRTSIATSASTPGIDRLTTWGCVKAGSPWTTGCNGANAASTCRRIVRHRAGAVRLPAGPIRLPCPDRQSDARAACRGGVQVPGRHQTAVASAAANRIVDGE